MTNKINTIPLDVLEIFNERKCEIIKFTKKSDLIYYICVCGFEKAKSFKDFKRRGCRTCNDKKLRSVSDQKEYIDEITGELWKPIEGGWISSFGNCKNNLGKMLTLCNERLRYHINGKNEYAPKLIAKTFKIPNYDKLDNPNYLISHKDNNNLNIRVDNLEIIHRTNRNIKPKKSSQITEKVEWELNKYKDIPSKTIPELPNHIIYSNGEIWNGMKFLTFNNGEYKSLNLSQEKDYIKKRVKYYIHRIICYAFKPISELASLEEYNHLDVKHINGDKKDNRIENLEWCNKEIKKSNKTMVGVIQLEKNTENYINHFNSIIEASRVTGDREHTIRKVCAGENTIKNMYNWRKFESIDLKNKTYCYFLDGNLITSPFRPSIIEISDD